jgi:protoporphyrinogen oxidase
LEFANALVEKIEELGGRVLYNASVDKIESDKNKINIQFLSNNVRLGGGEATTWTPPRWSLGKTVNFDKVVVTLPSLFFLKIAPKLPNDYKNKLLMLKGLGATNLILRLKKPFLTDGTYWLNICDKKSPIMAIVEHTNFIDKKYYNNEHIVYLGNYLPHDHQYMKMRSDQLLKVYDSYLKKINPNYSLFTIHYSLFTTSFAQPIISLNYSKIIPPFETPLKNVYLANIQQVYPWDRGTNYAVGLGEKVAKLITNV